MCGQRRAKHDGGHITRQNRPNQKGGTSAGSCRINTHDAAGVAGDGAVAVVAVRIEAAAVFVRHRAGLDPACAARDRVDAAAVDTETVVVTGQADTLKGCGRRVRAAANGPKTNGYGRECHNLLHAVGRKKGRHGADVESSNRDG